MHEGTLKPEQLSRELLSKTYNDLETGAKNGYGKGWAKFPADGKGSTPIELKKNLYAFSGAKTYAQLEAINKLLVGSDGRIIPYNQFEQLARQVNRQYNKNYLQAEYQTALASAQMAEQWERIQENKDLFPNIEFRTVGDDRVRRDHEKLNGIIKPVDDDFWNRYYPPLDFRCRCTVRATAAKPTKDDTADLPPVQFKGNVGKDKEIFRKNGNFFKLANTSENATRNIELSKLNAPYEVAYTSKKGKKVEVNIYADPADFENNMASAKIIADNFVDIAIRAHINVDSMTNAEYLIKGELADLKIDFKKDNYKGIKSAFESAEHQQCTRIVFNLTEAFENLDISQVNRMIRGKVTETRGKWVKELYIIYNNKAINVTRENILDNKLLKELEKLKADS